MLASRLKLAPWGCAFAVAVAVGQDRPQGSARDDERATPSWTEPATRWQKATDIMGKKVNATGGEPCGEVANLIVDIPSGRVIYMMIAVDGRYAAVPSSSLTLPADGEKYRLHASKEQAKTFSYDKDHWPDFADQSWAEQVHSHYKLDPYWKHTASSGMESKENPDWYRCTSHWHKASDVIGKAVKNSQNEDVGNVEELIIDPDRDRVIFAVLSHGGVLGIGEKLFAVPWSCLTSMSTDHKHFVFNVDKDWFKNAIGFEKKTWPNFTDEKWALEIHKHYNRKPYWQDDGEPGQDNKRSP